MLLKINYVLLDLTCKMSINLTSVVSTAMGSVKSSVTSVSVKRSTVLVSPVLDYSNTIG